MRLAQLFEDTTPGTFVGLRLTHESNAQFTDWLAQTGVVDPNPPDLHHVTLILGKDKKLDHTPIRYTPVIQADPSTYEIAHYGPDEDIPVLKFKSDILYKRHMKLRAKYDVEWDFDDYTPHLTLSYEPQRVDVEPPTFPLEFEKEYVEAFGRAAT